MSAARSFAFPDWHPQECLVLAGDDHHVQPLNEANLDTWWANLPAEHKAWLYAQDLGCTDGGPVFTLRNGLSEALEQIDAFAGRFDRLATAPVQPSPRLLEAPRADS